MSQTRPVIPVEGNASTAHLAARPRRDGDGTLLSFPVLDEQPGRLGRRVAALPREGHPVWTYVCGILVAFALIASISIVLGLVVTRVLLHVHGVAGDDESFVGFLARHRSSGLTDASLVGSIIAGGVVLADRRGRRRAGGVPRQALASRRIPALRARRRVRLVPRDDARRTPPPSRGSPSREPAGRTRAIRPGTPRLRSRSTAASPCCSPRGSRTAGRGWRSGSSLR